MILKTQAAEAVGELSAIPYFPQSAVAQAAIIRALCAFVSDHSHLGWLVDTANSRMTEWRGIAELRALYCTRYDPADGDKGMPCSLPGFTPEDMESDFHRRSRIRFLPLADDMPLTAEEMAEFDKLIQRKVERAFMSPEQGERARRIAHRRHSA